MLDSFTWVPNGHGSCEHCTWFCHQCAEPTVEVDLFDCLNPDGAVAIIQSIPHVGNSTHIRPSTATNYVLVNKNTLALRSSRSYPKTRAQRLSLGFTIQYLRLIQCCKHSRLEFGLDRFVRTERCSSNCKQQGLRVRVWKMWDPGVVNIRAITGSQCVPGTLQLLFHGSIAIRTWSTVLALIKNLY